jgi:protein-S-isoprenylcysteine O-methyltransferase Ste14
MKIQLLIVRFIWIIWCLALASMTAASVVRLTHQPWEMLTAIRLFATICTCGFWLLLGWLVLLRSEPAAKARGWWPRVSAMLGSYLMMTLPFFPHRNDLSGGMQTLSTMLTLSGGGLAIYILSHLGRSFSIMAEARRLVTNGPYSLVRHPLYIAEFIGIVGAFIQYASIPTAILLLTQISFQILRIQNEESVLKNMFPQYADYMARTNRLIPGVW